MPAAELEGRYSDGATVDAPVAAIEDEKTKLTREIEELQAQLAVKPPPILF